MSKPPHFAGRSASWIKAGLPWVLALALSSGVAYMMNTAVVRALSTNRASDAVSIVAQDMSNPCALDVDDALYAGSDVWQPAGRSTFCRAERYPGDSGRKDSASQLARVGPLLATITFAAPTDIRIDLYCSTRTRQRSAEAFMSAVDARHMHEQVCLSTGSSPSGDIAPSAATQVANALLPVTIPIIIEDAPCTGSCEGALTIYCVTWQPGVASQPIVVPASDFSATSQELGCQPWAE
jgi:hypothetical protein